MDFFLSKLTLAALALVVAAAPGICLAQPLSIQVASGGNATLSWNASATGPVNVERCWNLANPSSWSVVSSGNSNGTFTESTGGATKGFYRLVPAFAPDTMVAVQGNATIRDLLVSNTETTWGEWKRVRTWATANDYDLADIGAASGSVDRQPVQSVSWFDALKWCNARSEMEGLTPAYTVNGTTYKTGNQSAVWDPDANGYRLPTEAEWAWAAQGGVQGLPTIYSGSNDVGAVAWYVVNSGGSPKPVGTKAANELAIFDMSGNVFEWCWDEQFAGTRGLRGGSRDSTELQCKISSAFEQYADTRSPDLGFRVVRNAP